MTYDGVDSLFECSKLCGTRPKNDCNFVVMGGIPPACHATLMPWSLSQSQTTATNFKCWRRTLPRSTAKFSYLWIISTCLLASIVDVEKTMFLDFDNGLFYNHHSDDLCDTSEITSPIVVPDLTVTSYSVEIVDHFIIQCGGVIHSMLSNKCYLADFESSFLIWKEFQLGVGMELPFMVAIGTKVIWFLSWITFHD